MDNVVINNYELFAKRLSELHRAEGVIADSKSRFNGDMPTVTMQKLIYVTDFLGIKKNEFVVMAVSKQLDEEISIIMDKIVRIRRGETIL